MKRISLWVLSLVMLAGTVAAQESGGHGLGDIVPRDGTMIYMASDRPDALNRMFGREANGVWKLRAFAERMVEREFAWIEEVEDDGEDEFLEESRAEAEQARKMIAWLFDSYDALARVEIALIDVTLDGPKFMIVLHLHEGRSIEVVPDFLSEGVRRTEDYNGIRYYEFGEPPPEPREMDDEWDEWDDWGSQPAFPMLENLYVAEHPRLLLLSNFETTLQQGIRALVSRDFEESLSSRPEFNEWRNNRDQHDLSMFFVAREIQNSIERLLPPEEDEPEVNEMYRNVNSWLQLREYNYIVFDFDFDEVTRGITLAGTVKTRRPTRLLTQFAVESREFKTLRYVPEGVVMTFGSQIGEAQKTFDSLVEFARDAESWIGNLFGGGRDGHWEDAWPPEDWPEERDRMDSVDPFGKPLRSPLQRGEEVDLDGKDSEVDAILRRFESFLNDHGTDTKSLLALIGGEFVVYIKPDVEAASKSPWGSPDMGTVMESSNFGLILAIKDRAEVLKLIDTAIKRAAEEHEEAAGIKRVEYLGATLFLHAEIPLGVAVTNDALLLAVLQDDGAGEYEVAVLAQLKGMLDASRSTRRSSDDFVRESSRFMEWDVGLLARIETEAALRHSESLDRHAEPLLFPSPTRGIDQMTVSMRSRESATELEIAMRITGIPDLWQFIEGDGGLLAFFEPDATYNQYNYSQSNMSILHQALYTHAQEGPVDLDALVAGGHLRVGALQSPFDARWQGDPGRLGWTTLDQVTRDEDGNLMGWIDEEAAEMIEANEAAGFRSFQLAEGDVAAWLRESKTGFIVAYQTSADTADGHIVLYADGQVGWLHAKVLKQALELNAEGEAVPSRRPSWDTDWHDWDTPEEHREEGERMPEDDPWAPDRD